MLERVEDRDIFDYHLNRPPAGKMVVSDATVREEMDAFAALVGMGGAPQ